MMFLSVTISFCEVTYKVRLHLHTNSDAYVVQQVTVTASLCCSLICHFTDLIIFFSYLLQLIELLFLLPLEILSP